jgi:hypothetical protein
MKTFTIRQGDVALVLVPALPAGCTAIPLDKGRIVLAYGEVTGHAHAIADHAVSEAAAAEIAEAAIARAKLWRAPDGSRFLQVTAPVTLKHEEHTQHTIPPGIYHLPRQVEYTPAALRNVAD